MQDNVSSEVKQVTEHMHGKTGRISFWLLAFLVLAVSITIFNIYFRLPMLKYQGFYEPDGFYHYSVVGEIINNNFTTPKYNTLSGFPVHAKIDQEPLGLYWISIIPYAILQYFGISYYTIMRLIAVAFGVFDAIGAYFLSRYLSKDKLFGLLVMAFVAVNMGDAARTSALVYRGDTFITIFAILALIFTIEIFKSASRNRKLLMTALTALSLSAGTAVWNGASFVTAIYVVLFALVLTFAFALEKKDWIDSSIYVLIALSIWFVLANIMLAVGITLIQTFMGPFFIMLLAFMLLAWILAKLLIEKKHMLPLFMGSAVARFAVAILFVLAVALIIFIAAPSFVYKVFIGNGFVITSNFAATIQELQPPSPQFLYASFAQQLYLTPMGFFILASTYIPGSQYGFWALVFISSFLYLFLHVYDSNIEIQNVKYADEKEKLQKLLAEVREKLGYAESPEAEELVKRHIDEEDSAELAGKTEMEMLKRHLKEEMIFIKRRNDRFMQGNARFTFDVSVGVLALIAYFTVTSFLQINAIRFNSLISIPLSIFAAFTVYWFAMLVKKHKPNGLSLSFLALTGIFVILFNILYNSIMQYMSLGYNALMVSIPMSLFAAYMFYRVEIKKDSRSFVLFSLFSIFLLAFVTIIYANVLLGYVTNTPNITQTGVFEIMTAISIVSSLAALALAYLVYWIANKMRSKQQEHGLQAIFIGAILIFMNFFYVFNVAYQYFASDVSYYGASVMLLYAAVLVAGALASLAIAYLVRKLVSLDKNVLYYAYLILVLMLVLAMLVVSFDYIPGLVPADGINTQFLSAMSWLRNNSAQNSVVLTLWPDGSVVEAIAHRTSITDSVGSQIGALADPFAAWLFNSSSDGSFLTGNISHSPDYLVTRSFWLEEIQGIYTESGLNASNVYDYLPITFAQLNQYKNLTHNLFVFSITYPSGENVSAGVLTDRSNVMRNVTAALKVEQPGQSTKLSYIKKVVFYNENTGNYSVIKSTMNANETINYTLLIAYSNVSNGAALNVTAAYAFPPGLSASNVVKLLFMCNDYQCAWNSSVAKLQLVYVNPDTKIYKIIYNTSANASTNASAS